MDDRDNLAHDAIDLNISEAACEWTVRAITALKSRLNLHIRMHHEDSLLEEGQIFLFNHFARFETFIPQYIINVSTGAFCRSVAASEFFIEGSRLSKYLASLGAVPNTYSRLLPFLAEEILRGRKVIIFPEGGMIKDRRVVDKSGEFSIFSPSSKERRKHHTGAAVLGLTLDAFKTGILEFEKSGDQHYLDAWAHRMKMESTEELLAAARKPTLIVPSNITFYPIRIGGNILQKGADLFSGGLGIRLSEELAIEGNLLLKDTDMDIRLGEPIHPAKSWSWVERKVIKKILKRANTIDDLFSHESDDASISKRLMHHFIGTFLEPVRDEYMREMYLNVTVNLSHLASRLIFRFLELGYTSIDKIIFHHALYLAVKRLQQEPHIHIHRSLKNPAAYTGLVDGKSSGFEQFINSVTGADLIEQTEESYKFLPKLSEELGFNIVRLENPVAVYANEVAPIQGVRTATEHALTEAVSLPDSEMSKLLFDDEQRSYEWDRWYFSKPRYNVINAKETATESGAPYFILPENHNGLGVVLVHGFLASPAELGDFGRSLADDGYPVVGVRLKGHGTSPEDLRTRKWEDWLDSVRRGYDIMSGITNRVAFVGFSTGGTLSLLLAADQPPNLVGVAAVSTPYKFRNKNLVFVPLMHGANSLTRWLPSFEGVMPYIENKSEHPHINYQNIPMRGLFELRQVVDVLKHRLGEITAPALILQGDADTVVDPESAETLEKMMVKSTVERHLIPSNRHGIINEDIGETCTLVRRFLSGMIPDHKKKDLRP